ncbi:FAD assembly factor SdhE [Novosphingopyxis sp. YJ-S2-01]|uniref:FAD assembly factor SdhE n=1 Tax=Novosphingopyxis sp. YJ-S2-01 TaxID=2794021 RepID=UPI0018DE6801|nr:succinate dehydrogenase assembly factor 2 [Novosphingopyxis sp. YJ-S2-01]MBH9537930.1 succinate dehydrogenase assembly factor 2 [Novosphingopyxis sp. YJ-S2-01]
MPLDRDARVRRTKFRAWHRGTREADYMIGGFFDRHHESFSEADFEWFERLLEEQDVDIMAWGIGTQAVPSAFDGPLMDKFRKLDFIDIPR